MYKSTCEWIDVNEMLPENGQKIIALYPLTGGDTWCEDAYYNENDCRNMLGWMPFPDNIKAHHLPELGNLMFGNSRGAFPIEDRNGWSDAFWEAFEDLFDGYGYYAKSEQDPKHTTDRGGYENDVFFINPYYWGEEEEIEEQPNFRYKPTGFEIQWYKYPFRDSYCNRALSLPEAKDIFRKCADSMRKGG